MISWWNVNGCYFSGLVILMCFPMVFMILRKKGCLTELNDNWTAFIWALMTVAVFVATILFMLQDYGIQEKVNQRSDQQTAQAIKDIQARYDSLLAEQKKIFEEKEELFNKEITRLTAENAKKTELINQEWP